MKTYMIDGGNTKVYCISKEEAIRDSAKYGYTWRKMTDAEIREYEEIMFPTFAEWDDI